MKLYILRHGEAAEHFDSRYKEAERPLTQKGIERTRQLAHALRQMEIPFDTILSSPLTRARQTAEIVARGIKGHVQIANELAGSDLNNLVEHIDRLRPEPDALLLVGHEPHLSSLVSLLCTGGDGLSVKLKKGALCRLAIDRLTAGKCATLEWLWQPRVVGLKKAKRKGKKDI
jgi:phosphohistidine phosphatase